MAVIGRLSRLSLLVAADLRRTFAAHDLDPASFDVLATLRRADPTAPLSPVELTRSAMVTSGAISQRLDRLEDRGLVSRTPSQTDGRSVHVALTPGGRTLIDQALPDHIATLDRLLHGLTPPQRQHLGDLLRSMLESLGDDLTGDAVAAGARGAGHPDVGMGPRTADPATASPQGGPPLLGTSTGPRRAARPRA